MSRVNAIDAKKKNFIIVSKAKQKKQIKTLNFIIIQD